MSVSWDASFFCRVRERSNEELKSKDRRRRERQWGEESERVFSLAKHLPGNGQPWKGHVHLLFTQVGRVRLSPCELNKEKDLREGVKPSEMQIAGFGDRF